MRTVGGRTRSLLIVAVLALVPAVILGSGRGTDAAPAGTPAPGVRTPVVLVVLDELPTASLMTRNGKRIDARRFPHLARFADGATWYRDHVAGGDFTAWAVPSILTGNLSNEQILPTAAAQPDNFFTLLGPGRTVHSREAVTEFCPVEICPDGDQGEFPEIRFADAFIKAKYKPFHPAEVREWAKTLPAGPGTLSFLHLKSPHLPLRYLPNGKAYPSGDLKMPNDMKKTGWTAQEPAIAMVQQRHLLQAGFADRLIGQILRQIRLNGDYRRALVVVTADHGISFDPNDLRRDVTDTNLGAIANPPLIIKYPGQTWGEVSTAPVQAIDILPTIAEALGVEIPPTDGRPVDQARPGRVMTMSRDRMAEIDVTARQIREDRSEVLEIQARRLGTRGLWKLGPQSGLIGRKVRSAAVAPWPLFQLDTPAAVRGADGSRNVVPALVSGRLSGVGAGTVLALGWNGKIVATTRAFFHQGRMRFGAMVPPAVMKRWQNRVELYLVRPSGRLLRVRSGWVPRST